MSDTTNDDELRAAARHCRDGCPGPSMLEVARGGHSCDAAIWRATLTARVDPLPMLLRRDAIERARDTAALLEQQLAHVETLLRDLTPESCESHAQLLDTCATCCAVAYVSGAEQLQRDALDALRDEPVTT